MNIAHAYSKRPRYSNLKLGDKIKLVNIVTQLIVTDLHPCESHVRGLCHVMANTVPCATKGKYIGARLIGYHYDIPVCPTCITDLDDNVYR